MCIRIRIAAILLSSLAVALFVAGRDGALWFTELEGRIGRLTPAGELNEFSVPAGDGQPQGLTVGPDGAIWFTEASAGRIGRITPEGTVTELPLPDPSAALADQPYWIPHQRMEYVQRNTPVPAGPWRVVTHSQNPFARECFIDELAYATANDPLDYRRQLLPRDSKELRILEATAKSANWAEPAQEGTHRGIAVTEAFGSYTAAVAELRNAAENPSATTHAWLFTGPPGSGRSVAARASASIASTSTRLACVIRALSPTARLRTRTATSLMTCTSG